MWRPVRHLVALAHRRPAAFRKAFGSSCGVPGSRGAAGLQGAGEHQVPPLVLVVDIDETLLRPRILPQHSNRKLARVDHKLTIDVGDGVHCEISVRPGVDAFFDWIRDRRSAGVIEGPWIFAQGARPYVDAVLSKLNPEGDVFSTRLLTHEDCTRVKVPGYVLKDLTRVPSDDIGATPGLSRVILVDNNSMSAILHPMNTLMIRDYRGLETEDQDAELERITDTLDELISTVRGEARRHEPAAREVPRAHWRLAVDAGQRPPRGREVEVEAGAGVGPGVRAEAGPAGPRARGVLSRRVVSRPAR